MEQMQENKQNTNAVSGSNIMVFSEEKIQEKRLTIASLIEKMNAEVVVGEIIDEHEIQRKKNIEEQKYALMQEQDASEAIRREEIEAERLAKEEDSSSNKAKTSSEETSNLSSVVMELSKKAKKELYKNRFVKKMFKIDDPLEEDSEEEENELQIEEVDTTTTKRPLKKKGVSIFSKAPKEETLEDPTEFEPEEEELQVEEVKETKSKKVLKKKEASPKKEKPAKAKKPAKQKKKQSSPSGRKIQVTFTDEPYEEEVYEEPTTQEEELFEAEVDDSPEEETSAFPPQMTKKERYQEEISRSHEPISSDEVYKFRSTLERLSSDSCRTVSVYAACIIDRDFQSLSIIKNVSLLAELIEESGDDMDFYFAYIITNKGVQSFGSDEALSEVTLAMEAIRTLFISKKGRVTADQVQKLPALKSLFQTIYYEDRR